MGQQVYRIAFREETLCREIPHTYDCVFTCPICGAPEVETGIEMDPYEYFMVQRNPGFGCHVCGQWFEFCDCRNLDGDFLFITDRAAGRPRLLRL